MQESKQRAVIQTEGGVGNNGWCRRPGRLVSDVAFTARLRASGAKTFRNTSLADLCFLM